jgi:hypothetical protein
MGVDDSTFGFRAFVEPLSWEAFRVPAQAAGDDDWIRYVLAIAAEGVLERKCSFLIRCQLFAGILAVQDIIASGRQADLAEKARIHADGLLEIRSWLRAGCGEGEDPWDTFFRTVLLPFLKEIEQKRKESRGLTH